MPKSRGRRGSRKPKNASRQRARARFAGQVPVLIPDTVTEAELSTLELIAARMAMVPPQPRYPGPLLIHADGAFECHGPDCPGATVVFHHEDDVDRCFRHPQLRTMHACPRCLGHSDGTRLAQHICTGQQIEHDDGGIDCTAGDQCLGELTLHMSSLSCRMYGPCPRNCIPVDDKDLE